MDKERNGFLYNFFTCHAAKIFFSCWTAFFLILILENLTNHLLSRGYEGSFYSVSRIVSEVLFLLFVIIFPFGIAFYLRKKSFAFWWIILLLMTLIYALSATFGFRNPLIDEPFHNQPLKRFLDTWSSLYFLAALIQGSIMTILYFCLRKIDGKNVIPFSLSFILTAFVILVSSGLLICMYILLQQTL